MSSKPATDIVLVKNDNNGASNDALVAAPSSPDPNMKLALPPSGFTEDIEKTLEINGPHVITFGWGDHGRTGITKETYEITQLSPRPTFLTIKEQIKIAEDEAKLKKKGRKKAKHSVEKTSPGWTSIPLPLVALLGSKTKGKVCEVACGDRHTIILTNRGQLWALGDSALGALGIGGHDDWHDPDAEVAMKPKMARRYIFKPPKSTRTVKHNNPKPLEVDLESAGCKLAVHIYCGGFSSYALSGEGKVYSWGENTHGQLGLMTEEEEKKWIEKEELEKKNARKKSWRQPKNKKMNDEGEDEDDTKDNAKTTEQEQEEKIFDEEGNEIKIKPLKILTTQRVPRLVRRLNKLIIKSLAAGHRHVLALTKGGGVVYSWGFNKHGQLGTLDTVNQTLPKRVTSLRGAVVLEIACGRHFSIAVATTDHYNFLGNKLARKVKKEKRKLRLVLTWGENSNGQCAAGHYKSPVLKPHTVVPCASWGEEDGGIKKPVNILGAAAGCFHSLFRDEQGRLMSAGNNRFGQLGMGDLYDRCYPLFIDTIGAVAKMACGSRWCLAAQGNGTIWAWGSNVYGEIGTGDKSLYLQPVMLKHLKEVRPVHLSAGNRHSAIIVTDNPDDSKPAFRAGFTHESITISEDRRTITRTSEEDDFLVGSVSLPVVSDGKYRWDVSMDAMNTDMNPVVVGLCFESVDLSCDPTYILNSWNYMSTGEKYNVEEGAEGYGEPYYEGDIIGVEVDRDIGYIRFYRNNVQQGIAYYVNFESEDRDVYLYVGLPGEGDKATVMVADDGGGEDDDDEDEETLICLNEEEDESKRHAPLQVYFFCASCKAHICRACAYQCHNGHSVGLKIQHGFRICHCTKSKPADHRCISLPEVDSDDEGGGGGGRRVRRHKKPGSKKVKKYSSLVPPAKQTFLELLNSHPVGYEVKK